MPSSSNYTLHPMKLRYVFRGEKLSIWTCYSHLLFLFFQTGWINLASLKSHFPNQWHLSSPLLNNRNSTAKELAPQLSIVFREAHKWNKDFKNLKLIYSTITQQPKMSPWISLPSFFHGAEINYTKIQRGIVQKNPPKQT